MSTSEKLYAICKHKETGEYHVFPTKKNENDKCVFVGKASLCGTMNTDERDGCLASCRTTEEIREKAASIGDKICGNCMKIIYKTEEE
ncbi:MAG: hypothetical protein PF481_07730 [Bacteroidales bacterium]|jgi:hypothetical protein|nr:hypothetical protein [Bacteroidales bacterium]